LVRVPAAQRKEQLIKATVELLRRDGVQRLTVRGIAEEAGANIATVSYCFDGKDDLIRHAFDYWLQRMLDIRDDSPPGQGLRATVTRVADAYWEDLKSSPADVLAQLEFVTWAVREAPRDNLAKSVYDHWVSELAQVFQAAIDAAGDEVAMSATELAHAVLILIDGASIQYIADPANTLHKSVFDRMLDMVLTGVLGRPDTA
jgi:AcrR family transcriptional regulator